MAPKGKKNRAIRRLDCNDDLYALFGAEPSGKPSADEDAQDFARLLEESLQSVRPQDILKNKSPQTEAQSDQRVQDLIKKHPEPQDELDLHGCHAREAAVRTESFIQACLLQGFLTVRIIVGKGLHSEGPAVLPDVVEAKVVEMKKLGQVLTFKWEKRRKRSSGALVVYLNQKKA